MATKPYAVLRAIFMGGVRMEPGTSVQLTADQALELRATGRVGAEVAAPEEPAPEAAAVRQTARRPIRKTPQDPAE